MLWTYGVALCVSDNKMLEALIACEPEFLAAPEHGVGVGVTGELRTLAILSDLYDKELVQIITWAKLIPGKPA